MTAAAQHRDGVAAIAGFVVRFWLCWALLWISGTATRLASRLLPA